MICCIIVPGKIRSKQRPRFGKNGNVYTPTQTLNYESWIRWIWIQTVNKLFPPEAALKIIITVEFEIPASWNPKKRAAAIEGKIKPTVKPDIDNIIKICFDALNKTAYDDDKTIVELYAKKYYGPDPQIKISIEDI